MLVGSIVQPIVDACDAVLKFWHGLLGDWEGSWGVAIILLTFTVRLVILPLTFRGVKAMQRMQQLQPEIKKIQERYKEDRQRMNQEIMRFYQEQKVNPLGSCLPIVLQIPFFISLFQLLRSSHFKADIAGNEGFLFIPDLAEKASKHTGVLITLIVLYVGTQLAASAVTAIQSDPTQRRIMFALPFFFTFLIINFQAGLILYWITTNVWTIGQQLLVRKLYPKPEPVTRDDGDKAKPARGKPAAEQGEDGKGEEEKKPPRRREKASSGSTEGGDGAAAKPPPGPRKKKKRSGRRR